MISLYPGHQAGERKFPRSLKIIPLLHNPLNVDLMKIRKTPLFYLVLLSCLVGIPVGIYGLTLTGCESLIGLIILVLVLFTVVALAVEQLLIKLLQPGIYGILLIEAGLLAGAVAVVSPVFG